MFKTSRLFFLSLTFGALFLWVTGCSGSNFLYYKGQFDAWDPGSHGAYTITSSTVSLTVNLRKDTVSGEGSLVAEMRSPKVTFTDFRSTQNMVFEGTYDPILNTFEGVVHVTGGNACLKACEGVEEQVYDYPASWTGKFVDGDLVGEVDRIGTFTLLKDE